MHFQSYRGTHELIRRPIRITITAFTQTTITNTRHVSAHITVHKIYILQFRMLHLQFAKKQNKVSDSEVGVMWRLKLTTWSQHTLRRCTKTKQLHRKLLTTVPSVQQSRTKLLQQKEKFRKSTSSPTESMVYSMMVLLHHRHGKLATKWCLNKCEINWFENFCLFTLLPDALYAKLESHDFYIHYIFYNTSFRCH